ncbi:MAG TPA: hypothetical protein VMU53_11945 [Candidatus Sulfotelmatobacter sp.]|nr:hypothetical protein [Candidatus Sulfotelmatobacter sp.]
MAKRLRVGVSTFGILSKHGPLFGEIVVEGGSSRRGRAQGLLRRAQGTAPVSGAGSDDGDGPTDGESAHTSAAHAAGPEPCADSATTGGSEAPSALQPHTKVKRDLPLDGFEFVRQVNEEAQFVDVAAGILTKEGGNEAIKQKIFQQLMEIAYGKKSRGRTERVHTFINDLPTAIRD